MNSKFEQLTQEQYDKFLLETDLKEQRVQLKLKDAEYKYQLLKKVHLELQDKFEDMLMISDYRKQTSFPLKGKLLGTNNSNTLIINQFSDWHVEQVVSKASVNFLNEYNPDIAKQRVAKLTKNLIKLVNDLCTTNKVTGQVIHLGGDFINGWIHAENIETNALTPVEATQFATELLVKSLKTIFEQSKVKKFWILCSVGNHGRITQKYRYGNAKQTSYETMIYANLIREFASYKNVEFIFPDAGIGYFDLGNNEFLRFKHGHEVKFMGGVGGINVPLNRNQAGWDKTKKAKFNLMCHYHTASMPNESTMMNGSLVGYDGFAMTHGFKKQEACQSLILYNSKYDFTGFYRVSAEV